MVKKIVKYFIDDELHHPLITKGYRSGIVLGVVYIIAYSIVASKLPLESLYGGIYYYLAVFFSFVFVFDYVVRILGAYYGLHVTKSYDYSRYESLFAYVFSLYGVIDFVATGVFFGFMFSFEKDIQTILSMSVLLKIIRYTPALAILFEVVKSESKTLLASLYVMSVLTLSTSVAVYFLERNINEGFATLADALWWSVITLATVGYGDIVPQSELGKLLGGISAITGFGMFALPAGILANGFASEIKRLKEMVSLEMVAKVPLFAKLDESALLDIAAVLRVKQFRKNETIIKEGTIGDAMYFILSGSVDVIKNDKRTPLQAGDFFGEIALVENVSRTATIQARQKCELLELSRYDFNNLLHNKIELYEAIKEVAKQRVQG